LKKVSGLPVRHLVQSRVGAASLSHAIRNLTSIIGLGSAPRQPHLVDARGSKRDNLYAYVAVDLAVAKTPVAISGQIGDEAGLFDTRADGEESDWRTGAHAETKWLDLAFFHIDGNGRLLNGPGRDLASETWVASASRSF
jgi:hypothetical protein